MVDVARARLVSEHVKAIRAASGSAGRRADVSRAVRDFGEALIATMAEDERAVARSAPERLAQVQEHNRRQLEGLLAHLDLVERDPSGASDEALLRHVRTCAVPAR